MTDDYYDLFQPIYAPNGERFTCSLDPDRRQKLNRALGLDDHDRNAYRNFPSNYRKIYAENNLEFGRTFNPTPIDLPTARGDSDVIVLSRKREGKHETRKILEIYPFIERYNKDDVAKNSPLPQVDVLQILNSETYRGFGFAQGRGDPYFHPIDLNIPKLPEGARGIYLGEVKMCDYVYNQGPSMIYDWDKRVQYVPQNWTSEL